MSKRNKDGLTDQQERFCEEYLKDLNGKEAAARAGYSPATSQEQASRLLKHPLVRQRVDALMEKRAKRTALSADRVLENIERIATKAEEVGEYASALKGNELLGKHLKLFTERHEHSGPDGGAIQLQAVSDEELDQKIAEAAALLQWEPGGTQ
jgi:phage terminase small subunit